MANRLLPLTDYDQHDVVAFYSADVATLDRGVPVVISEADLNLDPIDVSVRDTAHGGWNQYDRVTSLYPSVPWKVSVASAGEIARKVLGITLWEYSETDENGEKLLFYPQKQRANKQLVSGEAVPIAKRGRFELNSLGIEGTPVPGEAAVIGTSGKFSGVAFSDLASGGFNDSQVVGIWGGTGERTSSEDKYTGLTAILEFKTT